LPFPLWAILVVAPSECLSEDHPALKMSSCSKLKRVLHYRQPCMLWRVDGGSSYLLVPLHLHAALRVEAVLRGRHVGSRPSAPQGRRRPRPTMRRVSRWV
jgi:hypothetical protein